MFKSAILILGAAAPAMATYGVDISQAFNDFSCLKSQGFDFVIPRAWCSYGGFDKHALSNIANAHNAGIEYVDVYMFPCRGKSASSQVSSLVSNLGGADYGQIWLDVEVNPSSGCSWASYSHSSNCDYLMELLSACSSNGVTCGVYTSEYEWETVMGSRGSCTQASSANLWYAHYDNNPSFSDYRQIGGWSSPNIKQYVGDTTACGLGVDKDVY